MAQRPIPLNNFNLGGIADSKHMGLPNSVTKMTGLDVHSEPGVVNVHQKLTKEAGANAPDEFCLAIVQCSDTNTYFFSSESGKIWKRTSAGTYSLAHTTAATTGDTTILDAKEYGGYLYWVTQNYLHRIPVNRTSDFATYAEDNWKELYIDAQPLRFTTQVLDLNGVNNYVEIASSTLTKANTFSFSAWLKVNANSNPQNRYTIWGCDNTASEFQIELGGSSDNHNVNRIAALINGTYLAETDNHAFEPGEWFHLTYVRNGTGSNHKIYVNGIELTLIANVATDYTDNACVKYIGARTETAQLFPGQIGQVRFWDVALTGGQVEDLYNGEDYLGGDLIAEYLLNGIADDTSGSNDGTLQNNADFVFSDTYLPHEYALSATLNESSGNKKTFRPRELSISYIAVPVLEAGTGNWTFVIHDDEDNLISTTTIANANMSVGFNIINITDAELEAGKVYHLHINSTVADGYVKTANYDNLEDILFYSYSDADDEFHPMVVQNQTLFIGDRNYIHQVYRDRNSGIHTFSLQALDIPKPLRIKTLGRFDTDVVIGTYVDDKITATEVLRWDTWSVSFSVSDPIPETGVNAFIDADNFLLVNAGLSGKIYYYDGRKLNLIRDVPGTYTATAQARVNPNAAANFKGLPLFGLSNIQGNPADQGIYSYGTKNSSYPQILSLDYPISQRSDEDFVLSNIEIGAILVAGNDVYVSWRDNNDTSVSGIDKLDYSNKLDGAYIQTRPADPNKILLNSFEHYYLHYVNLPEDCDLDLEYATNYGSFTPMETKVNAKRIRKEASKSLIHQVLELKVLFTTNGNDAPVLKDITIVADQ